MGNIQVAWEDVVSVVQQISGYLIAIGIALIAMIIVMIAARKVGKPKKGLFEVRQYLPFYLLLS